MKTTIEIDNDLFESVQRLAKKQKTTFRSLTEQGLRLVLKKRQSRPAKLPPLLVVAGKLTRKFKAGGWEKIRDKLYGIQLHRF